MTYYQPSEQVKLSPLAEQAQRLEDRYANMSRAFHSLLVTLREERNRIAIRGNQKDSIDELFNFVDVLYDGEKVSGRWDESA